MLVYLTIFLLSNAYYAKSSIFRHNTETAIHNENGLAYDKGFHGFIDRSNVTGIQKLNRSNGLEPSEHIAESHMGGGRKYFGSGVFISKYGGDSLYTNHSDPANIKRPLKNYRNCINDRYRLKRIRTGKKIDNESANSDRFIVNEHINIVPGVYMIGDYRRYLDSGNKVKDEVRVKGNKYVRTKDGFNNEGNIDSFGGDYIKGPIRNKYVLQSNISVKTDNVKDLPESGEEKNKSLTDKKGNRRFGKLQVGLDYIGHEVSLMPMSLSSSLDGHFYHNDFDDDSDDNDETQSLSDLHRGGIGNIPLAVPKWLNKRYQIYVNNIGLANEKTQALIDDDHRHISNNENKIISVKPTITNDYKDTYSYTTASYSYESLENSSDNEVNHNNKVYQFVNENKASLLKYWLTKYFKNSNRNSHCDDEVKNKGKIIAKNETIRKSLYNAFINDVARDYLDRSTDKNVLESRFTVKNDQFESVDQNTLNSKYLNSGNGNNMFKVKPSNNGYIPTAISDVNSKDSRNLIFDGDSNNAVPIGKIINCWRDNRGFNIYILCSSCCGYKKDVNNGAPNNADTGSSSYLNMNSGSYVNGEVDPVAGQNGDYYTQFEEAFIPTAENSAGKSIGNLNFDSGMRPLQAQGLSSTGDKGIYKDIIYNYGDNDVGLNKVGSVDNSGYVAKSGTSSREKRNDYNVNTVSSRNELSKLMKKIVG